MLIFIGLAANFAPDLPAAYRSAPRFNENRALAEGFIKVSEERNGFFESATSTRTVHAPIAIEGDADFTRSNGVVGGSGKPGNPFRIEGWTIETTSSTAIDIRNTTSHFVIQNVSTAASYPCGCHDGVSLFNVQNAIVLNSTFLYAYRGVFADISRNVTVAGIAVESSPTGVSFVHSLQISVADSRTHNTGDAIWLNDVTSGRIVNNSFSSDPGGGPSAIGVEHSTDVAIYHNDVFVSPAAGWVSVNGLNNTRVRWDDGYPNGGNNWSDYRGWDDCAGPNQDLCTASDGLGDFPYDIGGPVPTVDRYPLVAVNPPNQPPVVVSPDRPDHVLRDIPVTFDAWRSYDPDGWPLRFDWDLGDGTTVTNGPSTVTHTYTSLATRYLNLTGTDVRGAASTVTLLFRVTLEPILSFTFEPMRPLAGEPVRFNASSSVSRDGELEFEWYFSDGGYAQGVEVTHVFATHGSFFVKIFARTPYDVWNLWEGGIDVGPAWIPLAVHDSSAGFRIPVPTNYTIEEDQVYGGVTVELVLLGPTSGSVRTNIVIDTGVDNSVRETREFLQRRVDETVQSASRTTGQSVRITEGPTYRAIGGHAAVVFTMQYGSTSVWQRGAIVVSEAHQRYWILVLTVDASVYDYVNQAFERMLQGFEITLPPQPAAPLYLRAIAGIAVASILGIVLLIGFRVTRRAKPHPPGIKGTPATMVEVDRAGPRFCPACGAPATPGGPACSRCGAPFDRVGP